MKPQTTQASVSRNDNPLREIMNNPEKGRRMKYKVGNLYYQFISNSSLADRRGEITGEHVADILEEKGYIKTAMEFGKRVYWWSKEPPTKADFFRTILGLNSSTSN